MVAFPPCKINLGLHIVGKRPDGFHDIETCFYPVPFTDIIEVIPSGDFSFSMSGREIPGAGNDNLCVQAYRMLAGETRLPGPVKIHLHKIVPMGAGLGGGSSDGAYCLRLINQVLALNLSPRRLAELASRLGSDCAFFIHDLPMIGTGRGEVLAPVALSLKGKFLVLINPGIHVPTKDAYARVKPKRPVTPLTDVLAGPMTTWKGQLINDFEVSVFEGYPVIGALKERMYEAGAVYAAMSGSGSSIFGIFDSPVNALSLFEPRMLLWSGILA